MRLQCASYAKQCGCNALLSDCNAMRLQYNGEDAIGRLLHCDCNAMRCDCNATQCDGTISPSASLPSVFPQGPRVRRDDKCEESGSGGGFSLLGQGGTKEEGCDCNAMQCKAIVLQCECNATQCDCNEMRLPCNAMRMQYNVNATQRKAISMQRDCNAMGRVP